MYAGLQKLAALEQTLKASFVSKAWMCVQTRGRETIFKTVGVWVNVFAFKNVFYLGIGVFAHNTFRTLPAAR